ncbi:MAG: hypothetical protein P4L85_09350 [Paludisphaera borealis]|uniref:hypothetical protein n=1 Tax=Paludisphaera borealis TaxID=1387353 RepID=UPI00284296E1|nr:hypothetical protein [Paludisphaera borealis]MDR3619543.1 hypothetical protein [Paludisphaera borealis]
MTGSDGWIAVSRGLTADERRVLRWLLTIGAEISGTAMQRATAFLPQLDQLRVTGRCICGCPSIDLALETSQLLVDDASGTLADVDGCSPEGPAVGLILRAKGGHLSGLEAYARDGVVPFSLPTDEQLASFG